MIDKVLNKGIDVAAAQLDRCKDIAVALHKRAPSRYWIATGALIGAIVAGCLAGYLQRDFGKRNLEYEPIPDMSKSVAAESQYVYGRGEGEDFTSPLPRGATDLVPPDGTVYRGQQFYSLRGDEMEKSKTLVNPYAGLSGEKRDEVLARGKELFRWTCQGCHGVDGVGSAPVTHYGVPAPKIADKVIQDRYTDGEIFHIITYGIRNMKPHASHVKPDDRWKLVTYLRKLQREAK